MILYRTPGRSFTRPPRTSTIECSWRLCPTPGMYAVTSIWLLSFTRATLRSAEFGFLGVVVYTRVHTPRRWGLPFSAGVLVLLVFAWRPLRTSCWIVGTGFLRSLRPLPSRPHRLRSACAPGSPEGSSGTRGRACRPAHGPATHSRASGLVCLCPGRSLTAPLPAWCLPRRYFRLGRTHELPGQARARGERVPIATTLVKTRPYSNQAPVE